MRINGTHYMRGYNSTFKKLVEGQLNQKQAKSELFRYIKKNYAAGSVSNIGGCK
jgi:hypothetical protein